jgi:hypothetical protein
MGRYLPQSPANLSFTKAKHRRLKELEYVYIIVIKSSSFSLRCCIAIIECLTAMLNQTEFNEIRNENLKIDRLIYFFFLK